MRRITIGLIGLVLVIALVGATSSSSGSGARPAPAGATAPAYSSDVLSRASAMTQQMSVAGPSTGHEYHAHANDEQVRMSSSPAFVRQLEAYQSQIDRMLARTP